MLIENAYAPKWFVGILLITFGTVGVLRAEESDLERPNIILILADDIGAECFRTYGGASYSTPNISKLARQGIQFNHFYSQPKCTHTRLELLTGKHNSRNYVGFATLGSADQFTIVDLLKMAGYHTGIVGKWQLGYPFRPADNRSEVNPAQVGFDRSLVWVGFNANKYDGALLHSSHQFVRARNDRPARMQQGYGPNLVNRQAIRFIEESFEREEPFFLYYPMRLPHAPFSPPTSHPDYPMPDADDVKYFPSMVRHMDLLVGRLVDAVDELGIGENTMIIFLSDNGTNRRIVSRKRDGTFVRGGKGRPHVRDAMHVPFIVRWPAGIQAGIRSNELVDSLDLMPTLGDLTSVELPGSIDGMTLLDDMRQQPTIGKTTRYSYYPRSFDISEVATAVFSKRYKLQRGFNGRLDFFNLHTDPDESRPLHHLNRQEQLIRSEFEQKMILMDALVPNDSGQ